MEQIINLHIERLPEGVYLATSDDISGLIAQGRTITETLEIARDVARKLLEAQADTINLPISSKRRVHSIIRWFWAVKWGSWSVFVIVKSSND
ncbi:MAG: type II toxin-antitoxin system HicB family antitoxin, partial [Methylobacter sp.]|nr:type II toxin-antitoxin system HicB family antitoxin [Methylobacter sp.]